MTVHAQHASCLDGLVTPAYGHKEKGRKCRTPRRRLSYFKASKSDKCEIVGKPCFYPLVNFTCLIFTYSLYPCIADFCFGAAITLQSLRSLTFASTPLFIGLW